MAVVEMGEERGCVSLISPDGKDVRRLVRTGRPNAVVVDPSGSLWVAESHPRPALLRVSPDGGDVVTVAASCAGRPLLFPNDLVFGPDGHLYLTDSGILLDDWSPGGVIRADYRTAPIDGRVIRIDPETGGGEILDDGIAFANGIAVDALGDLYVNEMITGAVFRYRWSADRRRHGGREAFSNVLDGLPPAEGFRGPDGMAFAPDGRLACTIYGAGQVAVVDRDGGVAERIATAGRLPTNVLVRTDPDPRLYVTECERGIVEAIPLAAVTSAGA
jgi:gluconolactonase